MSTPPATPRETGQAGQEPPAALRARVLAAAREEAAPTRDEHRGAVRLVLGATIAGTFVLLAALGGFRRGSRSDALVGFVVGAGLTVAAFWSAITGRWWPGRSARARSMLGRPRGQLLFACIALAPLLAVVPLAADSLWSTAQLEAQPPGPRAHIACALLLLLQGSLPLLAFVLVRRGSDPVHPALTGAALGATAGAVASVLAYVRCPHPEAFHCVVAHVLPVVFLTLVGLVAGSALIGLRRRS
jgi:hypothetical protein